MIFQAEEVRLGVMFQEMWMVLLIEVVLVVINLIILLKSLDQDLVVIWDLDLQVRGHRFVNHCVQMMAHCHHLQQGLGGQVIHEAWIRDLNQGGLVLRQEIDSRHQVAENGTMEAGSQCQVATFLLVI
jgi:hypothetical protein